MLEDLKKTVCEANLDFVAKGGVFIDKVCGVNMKLRFVVKPSDIDYLWMKPVDKVFYK